ncbi:hypothetical protein MGA5115_02734 [Marinomonas gallaica]|uniref:DUF2750 domain-containing protein n=1 Tax=Marinomonas gallaica TaxID=1806667 RepID=A0A1C3JTX7_9GAMM|nr:DUF2750 domain-containing protein [Marinomonas gallaica]SBT18587.1 hypothetical protein MGA5115_02734 [Marinomonas gallaica]SBT21542.1 hypothetical protein MGA5116_02138 [Marinomonas gallaica]
MTIDNTSFFRETSQNRYDLFVAHVKSGGTCYTLADTEGCLNITIGSERVLPVWPTEEMANEWAKSDYEGFSALDINNEAFFEVWLPGMTNDGVSVGVAPNMAGEGIVLQAAELLHDIQG